MRRWSILLLISLTAAGIYACGGGQTPSDTSSTETCPLLDAGPPPVCPDGCLWNGTECRKKLGIIMEGSKRDSGAPAPTQ
jgi:hypothetical protein